MKAEQFIYALFKGYGIKLIKSPGLNNLLNSDIINFLCQLFEPREYNYFWPNGVITTTYIQQVKDEYGRSGVYNHTIAVKVSDYLAYLPPNEILHSYFTQVFEPPRTLSSINVKEEKP